MPALQGGVATVGDGQTLPGLGEENPVAQASSLLVTLIASKRRESNQSMAAGKMPALPGRRFSQYTHRIR